MYHFLAKFLFFFGQCVLLRQYHSYTEWHKSHLTHIFVVQHGGSSGFVTPCVITACKIHEVPEREKRYGSTLSLTSALYGGGWSTPRPGRFTPGRDPVLIVQEDVWASRPFWTGVENLPPTGVRYPDRSASSELLYRLSYRGPPLRPVQKVKMRNYFFEDTNEELQQGAVAESAGF